MIHIPLKVTTVDGAERSIESIADLYDVLGGAATVNLLSTHDNKESQWVSYLDPSDTGTAADKELTDDTGILTGLKKPVSLRLGGDPLGTNGSSTISLLPGSNCIGLPLKDSRIARVSDLFALEGMADNVSGITVLDSGDSKRVSQVGDDGDIPVTGGQAFVVTAQRAATDTTPVLALSGSIVNEEVGKWGRMPHLRPELRVTLKNLLTRRAIATVTGVEGVGYQFTVVDIEKGRAATIGDILEISAQSPNPFIGVQPLRYTVTAEDVKRSWIQLPALVAYEIPAETELLPNYPNPFNPETWIPYRLAEDAFVTLTIYDGGGRVVRTLDVGHQVAAVYESRSQAVYWDGRNEVGERVASGVYFYHLSAGDYSATRRMLILK